jgi:hypothetical protein
MALTWRRGSKVGGWFSGSNAGRVLGRSPAAAARRRGRRVVIPLRSSRGLLLPGITLTPLQRPCAPFPSLALTPGWRGASSGASCRHSLATSCAAPKARAQGGVAPCAGRRRRHGRIAPCASPTPCRHSRATSRSVFRTRPHGGMTPVHRPDDHALTARPCLTAGWTRAFPDPVPPQSGNLVPRPEGARPHGRPPSHGRPHPHGRAWTPTPSRARAVTFWRLCAVPKAHLLPAGWPVVTAGWPACASQALFSGSVR